MEISELFQKMEWRLSSLCCSEITVDSPWFVLLGGRATAGAGQPLEPPKPPPADCGAAAELPNPFQGCIWAFASSHNFPRALIPQASGKCKQSLQRVGSSCQTARAEFSLNLQTATKLFIQPGHDNSCPGPSCLCISMSMIIICVSGSQGCAWAANWDGPLSHPHQAA